MFICCSQDVDSDHMFTPQPSNTSLDSGSGSLALGGRSVSVTGAGPTSFMPRSIVRPDVYPSDSSPSLNKRSVSFVRVGSGSRGSDKRHEIVASGRHAVPWTFKRHCMSVGDSIDERVESTDTEYLSVRSLATPAVSGGAVSVPKLEPCPGGSNIVAMVADSGSCTMNLPPRYHQSKPAVGDTCRRCSGTLSSIDRASDCSSNLSTSSNAVFATSQQLVSKDDLRRCFSGEQIGMANCTDGLNSDNWYIANDSDVFAWKSLYWGMLSDGIWILLYRTYVIIVQKMNWLDSLKMLVLRYRYRELSQFSGCWSSVSTRKVCPTPWPEHFMCNVSAVLQPTVCLDGLIPF